MKKLNLAILNLLIIILIGFIPIVQVISTNYYSYTYETLSNSEDFDYTESLRNEINNTHVEENTIIDMHNYTLFKDLSKANNTFPSNFNTTNINQTLFDYNTTEYVDFKNDNESYGYFNMLQDGVDGTDFAQDTMNGTALRVYNDNTDHYMLWQNTSTFITDFTLSFNMKYYETSNYPAYIVTGAQNTFYPQYARCQLQLTAEDTIRYSDYAEAYSISFDFVNGSTYHFYLSVGSEGTFVSINNQYIVADTSNTELHDSIRGFGIGLVGTNYHKYCVNASFDDIKLEYSETYGNSFEENEEFYYFNDFQQNNNSFDLSPKFQNSSVNNWDGVDGKLRQNYVYYWGNNITWEYDYTDKYITIQENDSFSLQFDFMFENNFDATNNLIFLIGNTSATNYCMFTEYDTVDDIFIITYIQNAVPTTDHHVIYNLDIETNVEHTYRIDYVNGTSYFSIDNVFYSSEDIGLDFEIFGLGIDDGFLNCTYDNIILRDWVYKNYTNIEYSICESTQDTTIEYNSENVETSYLEMDLNSYPFDIYPLENNHNFWNGCIFDFSIIFDEFFEIMVRSGSSNIYENQTYIPSEYSGTHLIVSLNSSTYPYYYLNVKRFNDSVSVFTDYFEASHGTSFKLSVNSSTFEWYGFTSNLTIPKHFESEGIEYFEDFNSFHNRYYDSNDLTEFHKINDKDSHFAYEQFLNPYHTPYLTSEYEYEDSYSNTSYAQYYPINGSNYYLSTYNFAEEASLNFTDYYLSNTIPTFTIIAKYTNESVADEDFEVQFEGQDFYLIHSTSSESVGYIYSSYSSLFELDVQQEEYYASFMFSNNSVMVECEQLGIYDYIPRDELTDDLDSYFINLELKGKYAMLWNQTYNSINDFPDFYYGYKTIDLDEFIEHDSPSLSEDNTILAYTDLSYMSFNITTNRTDVAPDYEPLYEGTIKTEVTNNEFIIDVLNESEYHYEQITENNITNNTQYQYTEFNSTINITSYLYLNNYYKSVNISCSLTYFWYLTSIEIEASLFSFILSLLTPFIMFFIFPFVFKKLSSKEGSIVPIAMGTILSFILMAIMGTLSLINATIMIGMAILAFIFLKKKERLNGGNIND